MDTKEQSLRQERQAVYPSEFAAAGRRQLAMLIEDRRRSREANNLSYHGWVSPRTKSFCMTVPKVACSKIKLALRQLEGGTPPDELGDIHDGGLHLTQLPTEAAVEVLTSPDWFRFCFVRNPYSRLFSAYKSKMADSDQQFESVRAAIRQINNYPIRDGRHVGQVAFRDFVRFVQLLADEQRNAHWQTQTAIIMPTLIRYDFIGRLETFEQDFGRVLRHLGGPQDLLDDVTTRVNPTNRVWGAAAYDRNLADEVHRIYREDFDYFRYASDSWLFDPP